MNWEHCLVVLSAVGTITFVSLAVRLPEKRLRLGIPIVLLLLLLIYEALMIRWEKTVHAPIRLDLVMEVPLMFLLLAWGIAALIFPLRKPQQK